MALDPFFGQSGGGARPQDEAAFHQRVRCYRQQNGDDRSGEIAPALDTARARSYGIVPEIGLAEGIAETMDWYRTYRGVDKSRYSYFRSHPAAKR